MEAMKTNRQDILASQNELKDTPFAVPEGYFESFKSEMTAKITAKEENPWKKLTPYFATAAAVAILLVIGSFIKDTFQATETYSQEEYSLFSNNLISTEIYDDTSAEQYAEAGLMEEDIIQYLIYIGAELESIELEK